MSESELDAILNEIRTRGKGDSNMTDEQVSIQRAMDAFSSTKEKPAPEPIVDPAPILDKKSQDEIINELFSIDQKETATTESNNFDDLISASSLKFDDAPNEEMSINDIDDTDDKKPNNKSKKPIIAIIAIILVIAIGAGVYFGVFANKGKDDTKEITKATKIASVTTDDAVRNPLTGEDGFNPNALDKRPVAIVVENEFSSTGVRPQWGINEADIILEGEAECSTRALLFWADYNKVPEKVGPTRSARPPFIHFSQLFNSVFIHSGLSRSKGDYEGADSVFQNEGIDHINLLELETDGYFIGRDSSRTSVIEHTAYLNGTNLEELLQKRDINTTLEPSKFSTLNFNTEAKPVGTQDGKYAYFKWSANCPDEIEVVYDESEKVYTTTHFDSTASGEVSNCKWTNCIFLFDTTSYVQKQDYKGAGNTETYCDYMLEGGEGMVLSNGTAVKIKWGLENGKLFLKDAETDKDVFLNPGKSYIGYGSSNHDGKISLTKQQDETTTYDDYE